MDKANNIAIVVAAYNRPESLTRLLTSISNAYYPPGKDIPLIISIDYSGSNSCYKTASSFVWSHGTKRIISYDSNIGLKQHIINCGELACSEYEAIIVLEDDLFVSPAFYDYSCQAADFYQGDDSIAGISLYSYKFNECAELGFEPVSDGFDNYFMKVPSSWGQLWTRNQWSGFKRFLERELTEEVYKILPFNVQGWPNKTSWKKVFYLYLASENKYIVYPRISLSSNFGDAGTHYTESTKVLQVPILNKTKTYLFSKLDASESIYDSFYELEGRCLSTLSDSHIIKNLELDLNGTKDRGQVKSEFLISSKSSTQPITTYAVHLYPFELNVIYKLSPLNNYYYTLALTETFSEIKKFDSIEVYKPFLPPKVVINIQQEVFSTLEFKIGFKTLKTFPALKTFFKIINNKK